MPLSAQTMDFLFQNRMQNSREWFHSHKQEYRAYVQEPLLELSRQLLPAILEIDPRILPDPRKAVSRINRDTRFSKDKSLYRDVLWVGYAPQEEFVANPPGYFFEASPQGYRFGCGYYRAATRTMEALRKLVLENHPLFQKAQKACREQDLFRMEGECYKRSHYPDQPEELRDWLERRNIYFCREGSDPETLFSERLAEILADGYRTLAPVYHLFCEAGSAKG